MSMLIGLAGKAALTTGVKFGIGLVPALMLYVTGEPDATVYGRLAVCALGEIHKADIVPNVRAGVGSTVTFVVVV